MLHLKKHLTNHRFSIFQPLHSLALSPVVDENDELIQAINDNHEETWTLEAAPDSSKLDMFWSGVERDLQNDPDWVDFAKEEE